MQAPKGVTTAVLYLRLGLAAQVFVYLSFMFSKASQGDFSSFPFAIAFFVLQAFVFSKISAGRNWARILTVFLSVLVIVAQYSLGQARVAAHDNDAIFTGLVSLALFILIVAAIWKLITEPVSGWFRKISSGQLDENTPTLETHVRCPDCKELVRKDARVCKHCGCKLVPQ
jgi:phosphoglycerol transferase MdoB-like AlkP superfamily enzyme